MDWMKLGSALLLGAMLVYLWPRAKHMLANSPKGSSDDWRTFALLIVGLAVFVYVLTRIV
jgi:hypothetical protein